MAGRRGRARGPTRTFARFGAPAALPPAWLGPVIAERHPALASQLDRDWEDIERERRAAVDVVLRGAYPTSAS